MSFSFSKAHGHFLYGVFEPLVQAVGAGRFLCLSQLQGSLSCLNTKLFSPTDEDDDDDDDEDFEDEDEWED